jgi:inorganic pyrophosphatase
MQLDKIATFKNDLINVIIETPRGSSHKYTYDPEQDVFKVKKTLPVGSSFPFDFGFIPHTLAEDGDPLDVLVIMDEPAYPGTLVACRLLGVLEATQRERDGREGRNDRIVAVPDRTIMYAEIKQLSDLSKTIEEQIANFFIHYNMQAGKTFTPLRWSVAAAALALIKASMSK